MKKLSKQELTARAKKLYFDKNKKIEKVFCDENGRFSYNSGNLMTINDGKDVSVFEITRKGTSSINTDKVNSFDKKEDIEKEFKPKKEAKEKGDK